VKYRAACSAPNYDNADFYRLIPCKVSSKKFLAAKPVLLSSQIQSESHAAKDTHDMKAASLFLPPILNIALSGGILEYMLALPYGPAFFC
jgi:hypothetical protein